jgi:hypothetical protein
MKKLIAASTLLPAISMAHDNHHANSFTHSLEHHLANPFFAIALAVGVVGLFFVAKKVLEK